jgi:hypothetical protein
MYDARDELNRLYNVVRQSAGSEQSECG